MDCCPFAGGSPQFFVRLLVSDGASGKFAYSTATGRSVARPLDHDNETYVTKVIQTDRFDELAGSFAPGGEVMSDSRKITITSLLGALAAFLPNV